ncbi:uncharacterized protein LOC112684792 [Sipha flava]|uniref:Uncharacterized protein LOC112684792 n=1 Tax=Sipha flava TaxID=143950 RepID=A0A8B8FMT7_9HEMI|nr:uncharacterized protein LOC112684792 [Sipha flava]
MQKVVCICIFAIICQTVFIAGLERTWNLRQKRMTYDEECRALMPGPGKKLVECCQMPNILPGLDKEWETCFETFKQMKDKPDSKEYKEMVHGKDPPCLFQCIFIQSGLVANDGKLNKDKIIKKMSEGMNNDEKWKSLWQPKFNKCYDETEHEEKNPNPMVIMNTPAGRLMKCFLRDMYMNCPKDVWVESTECTNMKKLVENCPAMPPPVFKTPPILIH